MNVLDYLVNSLMAVVLIVGSYQFYFFLQRRHVRKPIEFSSRIDELIPFRPGWVWVYTALYYPVILLGVLTIDSFAQFNYTAFSFIVLLAMQCRCGRSKIRPVVGRHLVKVCERSL
jgi:hypothetical protein